MNENQDKVFSKTNINWYPGHMTKTKREIKDKLSLIDIVYEVLDARMPFSSKIVDLDELIGNKPRILIFTKYDLCDKKKTDQFIKYYQEKGYDTVALDLLHNKNATKKIIEISNQKLKVINENRIKMGLKPKAMRALVVGVPNVGKSTLINQLVGRKATVVGDRPGVTKSLSWIRIHEKLELLDSPGILWPKIENQTVAYNLASLSSIKEEIIDLQDLSTYILKKLYIDYKEYLKERYQITQLNEDLTDCFVQIGKRRGALSKGGEVDFDKVYSIIVKDLKTGVIGNVTFDNIEDINN